jgi:hypothetical protein
MISTELARALRDSGLVWYPVAGDAFRIDRIEAEADVFYLSDMTIETHQLPTGTELGFNGTTEWALDSVDIEDALWLPSESQLREALAEAFVALDRTDAGFRVIADVAAERIDVVAPVAEDAYARALLALLDSETPRVE